MKKGFTIVEIIISISLILIIGFSVTFFALKNNDEDKLSEVYNKVIEATNLYINTEKDDNGLTYINGIQNGGKGVYLTVDDLYKNGYLTNDMVNMLEKEFDGVSSFKYLKILASKSIFNEEDDYCSEGVIEFELNFDDVDVSPIYLCPTTNGTIEEDYSGDIVNHIIGEQNISTLNFSDLESNTYLYTGNAGNETNPTLSVSISKPKNSGIFKTNDFYYYRGERVSNYIKFDNLEENFRIVSFNDSYIKIISDRIFTYDLTQAD